MADDQVSYNIFYDHMFMLYVFVNVMCICHVACIRYIWTNPVPYILWVFIPSHGKVENCHQLFDSWTTIIKLIITKQNVIKPILLQICCFFQAITIAVKDQSGNEIQFKIKRKTVFEKVCATLSKQYKY